MPRHEAKSSHVMQPVYQLYNYNSYILRHGKKHLPEVFDLLLLT